MVGKNKKNYLYTKLEEMLTLYEITPKLQTCCQECEVTTSRCCQRKSNAQLIISLEEKHVFLTALCD